MAFGEPTDTDPAGLTARETQVLERAAKGLPNRAIARDLGVSEHTVKFHLASLFRKLDVSNRTQAVATYLGSRGRI
jgi:two-component system, NarL family, response regulator YdfI